MSFSFSLVRQTLEALGFELRTSDDNIFVYFYHPKNSKSIIIDTDYELPESYIRDKVEYIGLSFEYFVALTKSLLARKVIDEKS